MGFVRNCWLESGPSSTGPNSDDSSRATLVPIRPGDSDQAAALHRQCRRRGETVCVLIDCLIGALAIRADLPILHCDSDALARHTLFRVDTE